MAHALLVERVDDRVAGAVGGGAGAVGRITFAVVPHMAAKRPLIDPPVLGARERHAEMFELDDGRDRLRHMYSIASWSPSQSEPLTVSYMCQRQSSSPILPSAALMPPCAATVWLRVGNTLVMQAVFSPSSGGAQGRAQSRAAGADDDDVIVVIGDRIGGGITEPRSARRSERPC